MHTEDNLTEEKITQGFFAVIEGPDGSGKDTLIDLVSKELQRKVRKILVTREPYFPSLREWLKEKHSPLAMILAMLGDRVDHLTQRVIPALQEDAIVLSSRYTASTLVYNTIGLDTNVLPYLAPLLTLFPEPDLYIYVTADIDTLYERINTRKGFTTRDDSDLTPEFLQQVSDNYESFFRNYKETQGAGAVLNIQTECDFKDMDKIAKTISQSIIERYYIGKEQHVH